MSFFLACLGVSILSTLGIGPVFILTFNRSALYGFLRGFITALGAAIADGLLFALGLAGFLSFIGRSKIVYLTLDFLGGFALIYMGFYYFRRLISLENMSIGRRESILGIFINTFFITLFNPGTILYFAYMSIQVSESLEYLAPSYYLMGVLVIFFGTLTSFTIVSFISTRVGVIITTRRLQLISKITGVLLVVLGLYFIYDFFHYWYFFTPKLN